MSTATWWYARKIVAEPVSVLNPPIVENPGPQQYEVGVFFSLQINNTGGDAASWTVDPLPTGLSVTQQTSRYCVVSGTPAALLAPDVVNPGDQTWSEDDPIDLTITNAGGPAADWTLEGAPENIRITEKYHDRCLVQNVNAIPLPPLNTTFFNQFLDGQHGPIEDGAGTYIGHGPTTVQDWTCMEQVAPGGDWASCLTYGFDNSYLYYDYSRCMMAAYYWLAEDQGQFDPRFLEYAEDAAQIWNRYYTESNFQPAARFLFTAQFQCLYDLDPSNPLYATLNDSIKQLIDNSAYCEVGDPSEWDNSREYRTRPVAYSILSYLDYLHDKPNDPYWSASNYPGWRDNSISYLYQWMDEFFHYGETDLLETAATDNFYTVWNNPNYYEVVAFTSMLNIEAAWRIYFQDQTGDVDKPLLLNRLTRYIMYDYENRDEPTFNHWTRIYEECSDPQYGNYIPGADYYFCDNRLRASSVRFWGGFRLANFGWLYKATGDRKYVDIGDQYWNSLWGSNAMFYLLGRDSNVKEHTQMLRYCFDYLKYRGGHSFKTNFSDTTGAALPPAVPTRIKPPVVNASGPHDITVDSAITSIQLDASNSPTQWTATSLPDGLSISDSGLISGTPGPGPSTDVLTASIFARNADGASDPLRLTFNFTRRAFSFANYSPVIHFDFTDTSRLWQDEAGTIPADTPGQTVARVDDQSGNGYHLTQATAAARPQIVAVADGTGVAVQFDGVDDLLSCSFPSSPQPSGVFCVADVSGPGAFYDGVGAANRRTTYWSNISQAWVMNGGSAASGAPADANLHVFYSLFNGGRSACIIDGGASQVNRTPNYGSHTATGLVVGNSYDLAYSGQVTIRHLLLNEGAFTDGEVDEIGEHYATAHGLSWTRSTSILPPDEAQYVPPVADVPVIDDPGAQTGYVGVPFSYLMTASNSPTSWSEVGLPNGLSIDNTGLISGTPTTEESPTASITATNAFGDSAPLDVDFTIGPGVPVVNDPGAQTGTVGTPFSYTMTASNNPTSWSAINLPDGLSIDNTGLISGTPATEESPTASITATNAGGDSAPQDVLFTISAPAPPFDWANYPNIQCRVDLTDLTTLWQFTNRTGEVTQAGDFVGAAGDQATIYDAVAASNSDADRGLVVSVPDGTGYAVEFDGVARRLRATFPGIAQPNCIFVVCELLDAPSVVQEYIADGAGTSARNIIRTNTSGNLEFLAPTIAAASTPADSNLRIYFAIFNTTSSSLYRDGGAAIASGNVGTWSCDGLVLGAARATIFTRARFRHSLINNGLLSEAEINEIGNHLASEHGLTWNNVTLAAQGSLDSSVQSVPQPVGSDWGVIDQWDLQQELEGILGLNSKGYEIITPATYSATCTMLFDEGQFEFAWAVGAPGDYEVLTPTVDMPSPGTTVQMPPLERYIEQGQGVAVVVRNAGGVLNLLPGSEFVITRI